MTNLLYTLVLSTQLSAAECPKINAQAFDEQMPRGKETKVYFFASWCGECASNLKSATPDDIVVASFDEQASAESVIQKLKVRARCFTSDGVAESFGIKGVPELRTVKK